MVPFVILLFVVVTFSPNEVESQCGKQEYQRCISLAEPLMKDPHLFYPNNTKDIESVCRKWTDIVGCIHAYSRRCFIGTRRQSYKSIIEMIDASIRLVCSSPEERDDYLKSATCMKSILTQDTMCGLHYKLLLSQVTGEEPLSAPPSSSHRLLRECVVDDAKLSCDPESASPALSLLDEALSFFRAQRDYITLQRTHTDCTEDAFNMIFSSVRNPTRYSADPTPKTIATRICFKKRNNHCVSLAEPLLKDPHLIYPNNTEDIESVCRKLADIEACTNDRCSNYIKTNGNIAVVPLLTSIRKVCSSPEDRDDYFKHPTCIKMIPTQDTMCGRHYKLIVSQVTGEAPPSDPPCSSVCCSYNNLIQCVFEHAESSCNPRMLTMALNFLWEQCPDYMVVTDLPNYDKDRCLYSVKTTRKEAVVPLLTSIRKVCLSPEDRYEYLKHATCMKVTLTQDTTCGRHYKLLVSQVTSREAPPSRPVS